MRVMIPHTLFSKDDDHSICYICKTESKKIVSDYLVTSPIEGMKTLLSVADLKKQYSAFKDKKKLLADHTHFVCDASVWNYACNLLGKTFSDRNNFPIPISSKKVTDLEKVICKVVDSTYMYLSGQNITIRFGHTKMSVDDVTENIMNGFPFAADKLGGRRSIRSVHLKTSDSPALQLYSAVPDEVLSHVTSLLKKQSPAAAAKPDTTSSSVSKQLVSSKKGKGVRESMRKGVKPLKRKRA